MEELQSTEILDREILEDARKKAFRILKTADETVKLKAEEWEKKTAEIIEGIGAKYAAQRALAAREIMARLPLDKRRAKAEYFETLLSSAVKDWYGSLSRGRVLSLLKKELGRRLAECDEFSTEGETPRALIHRLSRAEAEEMLGTILPGQDCMIWEMTSALPYPEIILENSLVRLSASINKTVDFLLQEKRVELIMALLGEDAQ